MIVFYMALEAIRELEELNTAQKLTKEFLEEEKSSKESIAELRKKLKIPAKDTVYGVDLTRLREFAKMLTRVYRFYDFPRFFKLVNVLWNTSTSLEEHYLALILLAQRKKDLDEPDVCLDLWNWLWNNFGQNVHDWSLTELITGTIGNQIIETWGSIEDEEASSQIWEDLKERARDEKNGYYGKVFAVLCPVKRIQKLGYDAILPTLEVILSAIAQLENPDDEAGDDLERGIMLSMRECAKADLDLVYQFLKKFYQFLPIKVVKDMYRYFNEEQKTEMTTLIDVLIQRRKEEKELKKLQEKERKAQEKAARGKRSIKLT